MNITDKIEKWEDKHHSLLDEYSKGNANNEVMKMYRSHMKNISDFINELKTIHNIFPSIILGQIVYHKEVYNGKEPLKVVGIREKEVELEGDYSGGTHAVCQKDWLSLEGIIFNSLYTKKYLRLLSYKNECKVIKFINTNDKDDYAYITEGCISMSVSDKNWNNVETFIKSLNVQYEICTEAPYKIEAQIVKTLKNTGEIKMKKGDVISFMIDTTIYEGKIDKINDNKADVKTTDGLLIQNIPLIELSMP